MACGPVSIDMGHRSTCVAKIMREVGNLGDVVPMIDLIPTFNGEMAFRVWTNEKRVLSGYLLWSLDHSPVFSHCLAYVCHGCQLYNR